jgi:hypothetical protein
VIPQPFWVITATIGSHSDRKWWIVCVQVDHATAIRVRDELEQQAATFKGRRDVFDKQRIAAAQECHRRWPRNAPEFNQDPRRYERALTPDQIEEQAQWQRDDDALEAQLTALRDELDMMDRRHNWTAVHAGTEVPEYVVSETSDVPRTEPEPQ